jgi:hypothetical protein
MTFDAAAINDLLSYDGTSEGVKKAWETRRRNGAAKAAAGPDPGHHVFAGGRARPYRSTPRETAGWASRFAHAQTKKADSIPDDMWTHERAAKAHEAAHKAHMYAHGEHKIARNAKEAAAHKQHADRHKSEAEFHKMIHASTPKGDPAAWGEDGTRRSRSASR